jgi:hypothetical protein
MFANRNPASPNFLSRPDKRSLSNHCNSSRKCRCVCSCSAQCYRLLRFAVFLPERRAIVLPLFFAGRPVLFFAAFFGTFFPALLASEIAIAIACLRLVTFLPLPPLRSVPRFFSRITFAIFLFAPFEYFAIMNVFSCGSEINVFVVKNLASLFLIPSSIQWISASQGSPLLNRQTELQLWRSFYQPVPKVSLRDKPVNVLTCKPVNV